MCCVYVYVDIYYGLNEYFSCTLCRLVFFVEPSEDRHLSISPSWLLSIFCQGIIIHIAIPSCNTLPGLPHLTSIGVVGLLGWTQIFIIIFIIYFS